MTTIKHLIYLLSFGSYFQAKRIPVFLAELSQQDQKSHINN